MFIDTNYFLRYFLHDIQEQNLLVEDFFIKAFDEKIILVTSTIVFFEVYWVLSDKFYKKSKEEAVLFLKKMLELRFIELKERDILVHALTLFERTNLDLEDCYNLFYAKTHRVNEFKTFDKKLAKEFSKTTI
jgi:predicted nucleic-acid-binding protein